MGDRLTRHAAIKDRARAIHQWNSFLTEVEELEPTVDEVELATSIEEVASLTGVALDGGESQLCAIAIRRNVPRVVTGDKRAVRGNRTILEQVGPLAYLAGRVACLEQLISALSKAIGETTVRELICAESDVDKALSICFQCSRKLAGDGFDRAGLSAILTTCGLRRRQFLLSDRRFPTS